MAYTTSRDIFCYLDRKIQKEKKVIKNIMLEEELSKSEAKAYLEREIKRGRVTRYKKASIMAIEVLNSTETLFHIYEESKEEDVIKDMVRLRHIYREDAKASIEEAIKNKIIKRTKKGTLEVLIKHLII